MLVAVVNIGIVLVVPPVVVTLKVVGGGADGELADGAAAVGLAAGTPLFGGAATTKAQGDTPPQGSASTAFSAYGPATSKVRGCSGSRPTWTASERAHRSTHG